MGSPRLLVGAFQAEALPQDPPVDPHEVLARSTGPGAWLRVWDHCRPVSMAAAGRFSPRGARVSLVCTPPEMRRRGYASACVAALSQLLLSEGFTFLKLCADLANPTSNRIYQAIGYRPIGDAAVYRFMPEARIRSPSSRKAARARSSR